MSLCNCYNRWNTALMTPLASLLTNSVMCFSFRSVQTDNQFSSQVCVCVCLYSYKFLCCSGMWFVRWVHRRAQLRVIPYWQAGFPECPPSSPWVLTFLSATEEHCLALHTRLSPLYWRFFRWSVCTCPAGHGTVLADFRGFLYTQFFPGSVCPGIFYSPGLPDSSSGNPGFQ